MGFLKNILKNNFGDPIEKLIRKLDSSSLEIQEKTIESLVKIGQPAVSRLIIETENENCIVARCACIALGKIGDSSAVDSLIAELKKDTYSKD